MRVLASEDSNKITATNDTADDPFYESTETHELIGVANVFLSCLFHDVVFDYFTPIISQQGEVAGRLQVQLQKVGGGLLIAQDRIGMCESMSESSSENSKFSNGSEMSEDASNVIVRVNSKIIEVDVQKF